MNSVIISCPEKAESLDRDTLPQRASFWTTFPPRSPRGLGEYKVTDHVQACQSGECVTHATFAYRMPTVGQDSAQPKEYDNEPDAVPVPEFTDCSRKRTPELTRNLEVLLDASCALIPQSSTALNPPGSAFSTSLIIALLPISASPPHLVALGQLTEPPNWPSRLDTLLQPSPRETLQKYVSDHILLLLENGARAQGCKRGWQVQALPKNLVRLEGRGAGGKGRGPGDGELGEPYRTTMPRYPWLCFVCCLFRFVSQHFGGAPGSELPPDGILAGESVGGAERDCASFLSSEFPEPSAAAIKALLTLSSLHPSSTCMPYLC